MSPPTRSICARPAARTPRSRSPSVRSRRSSWSDPGRFSLKHSPGRLRRAPPEGDGIDMEGVLAVTFIFGGGTAFLLAISPIGRAIAERIRAHGAVPMQDPELLAEVDALRRDVSELQERVDFAERLLAQSQERQQVGKGGPE